MEKEKASVSVAFGVAAVVVSFNIKIDDWLFG